MFHMGHLNLLKNAKSRCEYLIAGVVTDEVYMSYKLRPPVIPFEERLEIVGQCKYVDRAIGVTMELQDKWRAWEELHYDCHFAGSDHEGAWPELERKLNEVGAKLEFFPYTQSVSSTQIRKTLERDFVFRRCMGEAEETVLVLFGAGAMGEAFLEKHRDTAQPAFFVDNDRKKWGTVKKGIRVESPEKLQEIPAEKLFVVICSKNPGAIAGQLVQMGIRDYRIWPL
jgi:cytidyltransferase-like protein